ncbi:hypothetical protein [Cytobacillus kochii]|uniref:hypothetical protein n=1 Tax=Cytobacillus kochii TaxID=859143 RepID=UPI0025A2BD5D|nr:hypothetical protein [Cytobacillus kochii]MDM5205381.1 hypothetical protein [Cytobacillus kochii]
MCVSNNYIEQQAYEVSKEIRKNSLYKVVRVEVSDGSSDVFQEHDDKWNGKDFITKIILEDEKGTLYSVKPDDHGLRFAKGEISYKGYKQIQKKEDIKGFTYFFGITGSLIIIMLTLVKFLT